MNICFFIGNLSSSGGTERVTTVLANHLIKKDKYKIRILSYRNNKGISFFELNSGVEHDVLCNDKDDILSSIIKLRKYIVKHEIEILVNVDVMMGIYSLPMKFCTKTKIISWEHFNYFQNMNSKNTNLIRKLSLKICDCYIVLTKKDEENFKNHFHIKCPIEQIYNPMVQTSTSTYNSDSKIIMSVGHLLPIKGFDLLIEVAQKVLGKHADWKWHVYGEGSERSSLEKKIRDYKLDNKVILKGRVSNIEEHYKNASIFVMTSRMEGLPMTMLEAKANQLPIVSFDIMTGPNEIIKHEKEGYLVKPYDINMMARYIDDLINSKEKRAEFSSRCLEDINRFEIESIGEKWIKIFESI